MTNEDILTAFMAGAALLAASDGDISVEERHVVSLLIEAAGLKGGFPEAFEQFNRFVAGLRTDAMAAREAVWQAIEPVAAHPDLARTLVMACMKLSRADRQAEFQERQVVRELMDRLHVDPKSLG
jgi:tellurite resistance protein